MDYDSSTKFISSLAKFLQSLCNGYVEFDNGVEVIGHIYLSVDTGKKIDYILNEKVCKTDENSVTFISNSFHAQPAEKPKPTSKKPRPDIDSKVQDDTVEIDSDSNNSQTEPKSTNHGTLSRNANRNLSSPSHRQGKRPSSPLKSGRHSPGLKRSRIESQDQSHTNDNGLSTSSPAADPNRGTDSQALEGQALGNEYGDSYQQSYNQGDDESVTEQTEEQDIKPNIDTDVTFVKEEFAPPSQLEGSEDRNQTDETSMYSQMYHQPYSGSQSYSNQSYSMHSSSRLSYGANDRSDMYDPSQGSSHIEGDGTDPSVSQQDSVGNLDLSKPPSYWGMVNSPLGHKLNPILGTGTIRYGKSIAQVRSCRKCFFTSRDSFDMRLHRKTCNGKRHLTCTVCSKVLSRYDALSEHMRGIHGIGSKVTCRYCGKGFKYKPQVYQHQLICPSRPFRIEPLTSVDSHDLMSKDTVSLESASLLKCLPQLPPTSMLDSGAVEGTAKGISFPYDIKYAQDAAFTSLTSSSDKVSPDSSKMTQASKA